MAEIDRGPVRWQSRQCWRPLAGWLVGACAANAVRALWDHHGYGVALLAAAFVLLCAASFVIGKEAGRA